MEELVCKKCGLVNEYTVKPNGKHIEARCGGCNAHIKFLKQNKTTFAKLPSGRMSYQEFKHNQAEKPEKTPARDFKMEFPFGKYKGDIISQCTDMGYLTWLILNLENLKGKVLFEIEEQIRDINFKRREI